MSSVNPANAKTSSATATAVPIDVSAASYESSTSAGWLPAPTVSPIVGGDLGALLGILAARDAASTTKAERKRELTYENAKETCDQRELQTLADKAQDIIVGGLVAGAMGIASGGLQLAGSMESLKASGHERSIGMQKTDPSTADIHGFETSSKLSSSLGMGGSVMNATTGAINAQFQFAEVDCDAKEKAAESDAARQSSNVDAQKSAEGDSAQLASVALEFARQCIASRDEANAAILHRS